MPDGVRHPQPTGNHDDATEWRDEYQGAKSGHQINE